MYYIKFEMKNTIFHIIKYLYYFSIIVLLIVYLFPGSLIGYFLYGDLGKQPDLISNPIGTSINHCIYFIWLTSLAIIISNKFKVIFANIYLIFLLSILLEISHLFIPNRAFEYYDLLANLAGILVVIIFYKLFK